MEEKCRRVLSMVFREKEQGYSFENTLELLCQMDEMKESLSQQTVQLQSHRKQLKKAEVLIYEQKRLLKHQDELLRAQRHKKEELLKILEKVSQETNEEKTKQYIHLKLTLL